MALHVGKPFSLLLVSSSYAPILGGSEIEAQRVCGGLLRRGYSVTVLCAGAPPMPEAASWIDPEGVPVRAFGRRWSGRLRDYAFALGVVWTLVKERRRYQLVYFLMQGVHLAAGLPVARFLRKAIVMKISGSMIATSMRRTWLGRLELRCLRRWAYRTMILNSGMAEEAVAAGFTPNQLLWMPNPVDTAEFAPCGDEARRHLRARLGIAEDALAVLFVGRLAPEKELPSLLAAAAAAASAFPQLVLILVGEGPAHPELQREACRLGLSASIRFTGKQSPAQVRAWLQAADVFALVSSLEGFPCSLVEAMSAGLPSIVSAIPANLQLIDNGAHGLHAPVRDSGSIAAALMRLLGDGALRARMGAAARERVLNNYSLEKVLDRYEELFRNAAETPPNDEPASPRGGFAGSLKQAPR